jgi:hypothetical protein
MSGQDTEDAKIRAAVLDYVAGVLDADPVRMERALHPELAKRAYLPATDGRPQLSQMSAITLIRYVQGFTPSHLNAHAPNRQAEVVILDRYEGAASVRTTFDSWVDYMHLVRAGDEWKIINVLWELTPERWAARSDKPRSSDPIWPFPR